MGGMKSVLSSPVSFPLGKSGMVTTDGRTRKDEKKESTDDDDDNYFEQLSLVIKHKAPLYARQKGNAMSMKRGYRIPRGRRLEEIADEAALRRPIKTDLIRPAAHLFRPATQVHSTSRLLLTRSTLMSTNEWSYIILIIFALVGETQFT